MSRYAGAADAVVAVATGDEVAVHGVGDAAFFVRHTGLVGVKVMQGHVFCFVHGGQASSGASVHQILGHLGLAVDHHLFAAGQCQQVDAVAASFKHRGAQRETAVHKPFPVHSRANTCGIQQIDRALLQHPGADTGLNIALAALLNDDSVNARLVKKLSQQMPGWTAANNGYLHAHASLPCFQALTLEFYAGQGATQAVYLRDYRQLCAIIAQ